MTHYKVNTENKTIIVDMANVTDNEMRILQTYVAAGYLLKEKKSGLTFDDMRKGLKGNAEALKELDSKIKAKENYMIIKKWYREKIKK